MSIKGKGDKCDDDCFSPASYMCCNHKSLKFIYIQIILHIHLDTFSSNKER